jgi:hypothetical protein
MQLVMLGVPLYQDVIAVKLPCSQRMVVTLLRKIPLVCGTQRFFLSSQELPLEPFLSQPDLFFTVILFFFKIHVAIILAPASRPSLFFRFCVKALYLLTSAMRAVVGPLTWLVGFLDLIVLISFGEKLAYKL